MHSQPPAIELGISWAPLRSQKIELPIISGSCASSQRRAANGLNAAPQNESPPPHLPGVWLGKFAALMRDLLSGSCLLLLPRCVVSAEVFYESTPLTSNPLPALRHSSILSTIGSTPVVKLQHMAPPGVDVYVKVESFNPMGSIKDRMALGMIEYAEHHGLLKPGQTVVEATSGNTGLGLAMVCAAKGYPLVCIMSEAFSIERRKMMRFLGAKVVLANPDGV